MEDRDTREYWEWLDIEAADFRVYYTSYSTEEFKERWIKGLDRLFTKGYITLKTYLGLRMGKGKTNKVSNIVRLVARRIAWGSLNIQINHNGVFLSNGLKRMFISECNHTIIGMVKYE